MKYLIHPRDVIVKQEGNSYKIEYNKPNNQGRKDYWSQSLQDFYKFMYGEYFIIEIDE